MNRPESEGLKGMRVAIFETRFSEEFANLVRKQGAEPLVGPSLVEAPLDLGPEVQTFIDALRAGSLDGLLVLTGVGNRKLVQLVAARMGVDEFAERLRGILVAARGPKAVRALREIGVTPQVAAPEPHTWQTLLSVLEAHTSLSGKRLALQQYGVPHEQLTRALTERGVQVMQVPVYRWQLPDDLGPLERVIQAICAGTVEVVLFTSAPQAGSLLEVAERMGCESELRLALRRCALGSVGPSCTEGVRNLELQPDFEPAHGKMGHLVLEAARLARGIVDAKRQMP
ncbi:MAG: uroporphyrinogen-III synthase [Myxococcales bacterium]